MFEDRVAVLAEQDKTDKLDLGMPRDEPERAEDRGGDVPLRDDVDVRPGRHARRWGKRGTLEMNARSVKKWHGRLKL